MNGATNYPALDTARVPPKVAARSKQRSALHALGALAVIAVGAVLFWFDPAQYRFYPFCFFHELTGLNCPGCGGTRALHWLLHGNVMAALHANALLVISLPLFGWLALRFAVGKTRRPNAAQRLSPLCFWGFLVLAVCFSVLRNLPAFAWLSP